MLRSQSFATMVVGTMLTLTIALLPTAPVVNRCSVQPLRRSAIVRCQEATAIETPKMESDCGFDYVPLLNALQAGELREADQLTRDALITLAGERAVERGYVYFSEAPKLPVADMATIQRLWYAYSEGKHGYAVQKAAWESKKVAKNFDKFFARLGWKNKEGGLLRWLPEAKADEFIYELDKSPKGHLPLTSTLRGTQLLEGLMNHEAWELEGTQMRPMPSMPTRSTILDVRMYALCDVHAPSDHACACPT